MAAAKRKNMRVNVQPPFGIPGARVEPLGDRTAIHVPFTAEFTDDKLAIRVTIDVRNGRPVCTSYAVDATEGDLLLQTTEVARGYKLRWLAAEACAAMALERLEPTDARRAGLVIDIGDAQYTRAASLAAIEEVLGPISSRREPVTDERLQRFAEAYRKRFVPGRMDEFAASFECNLSERQGWRLLKLARERGFLPPKEAQ